MKAREYLVKARKLLDVGCPLYERACRKVFPGAICTEVRSAELAFAQLEVKILGRREVVTGQVS
jgi:hypothetical protein